MLGISSAAVMPQASFGSKQNKAQDNQSASKTNQLVQKSGKTLRNCAAGLALAAAAGLPMTAEAKPNTPYNQYPPHGIHQEAGNYYGYPGLPTQYPYYSYPPQYHPEDYREADNNQHESKKTDSDAALMIGIPTALYFFTKWAMHMGMDDSDNPIDDAGDD